MPVIYACSNLYNINRNYVQNEIFLKLIPIIKTSVKNIDSFLSIDFWGEADFATIYNSAFHETTQVSKFKNEF